MALNRQIKVPMPEKGIIQRKTGRPDVFKVIDTFRKDGKPDNRRKCIGQCDIGTGMLIPNNAYYEFYSQPGFKHETKFTIDILPSDYSVRLPGAVWLVRQILEELGIVAILDDVFGGDVSASIILIATYMVSRGNIMMYTSEWCETCVLDGPAITSQSTSRLFASISFTQRMAFFKQWVRSRAQTEYFAYDVTSFSSYAKGIENLEWGYNRDNENLPQINMALYVGQTSRLPVFYVTYQGSIVDKTHLKYMMAFNDELGIADVSFVLDCGFCTVGNLEYMRSKSHTYIVAVEIRHKATREAIEEIRSDFDSLEHYIERGVRGKSVHGVFYGASATMHVYYDMTRRDRQDGELMRTVENVENELSQRIRGHAELDRREIKRYDKYFDLELSDGMATSFSRNYEKINRFAKNHGFFCLLSNSNLSAADVLSIYRKKDSIEKAFDEVKNYTDMNRLHTHNADTTDGKLFCAFIALITTMHMQGKLDKLMNDRNLTKEKIILELEKIAVIQCGGNKRQYAPLSRMQKDIISNFGLTENDFAQYLQG